MRLGKLSVGVDGAANEGAVASFHSVRAALEHIPLNVFEGLTENILGLFVLGDHGGDLFVCEPVGLAAAGASELQGLKVSPSKRYNELVTAIAASGHGYGIRVVHGWPILSVDDRKPTVTEAGAVTSRSGEGAAIV